MKHYRLFAAAAWPQPWRLADRRSSAAPSRAAAAAAAGPFDNLHWRPIGPAAMSGRIADIAVYEANPAIWYVGTAHGGVWKTVNNGTTFEAQFQDQGLMSIGDIAVSQNNPDLVYVGTGESNNRQSTSWGDGVYKSTDGGKTYTNIGLKASKHINRDRDRPAQQRHRLGRGDRAALRPGRRARHLQDDRRRQDLEADAEGGRRHRRERARRSMPTNNKILYASTYQRRRTSCCMNGGGPGSGLWKSTDGGETWTRLKNGLPEGPLGRIGLDVYRKRPEHSLCARSKARRRDAAAVRPAVARQRRPGSRRPAAGGQGRGAGQAAGGAAAPQAAAAKQARPGWRRPRARAPA